ncbi:isochorismatase family protein [Actinokineospora enzanensis]|uniref:isochorismatase family protein n=1 Tax=Actinokineospora enzanensis TaxID=155975 RepID=UPI00036AE14E|nr:isochorismatase family protein [Actinokineospora enzanensis]
MAIQPIDPYPMPVEADLPAGRVSWRPDPRRAVLLVHDMQRYFVAPFDADREPRSTLVRNLVRLRAAAIALGIPVVYTAQPGGMDPAQRGLLNDFWGPGMTTAPADRRIIDALTPGPADVVLTKWRYSAFHRSDLADRLATWHRDQLLITGVYAHVGCLTTAGDAFALDIRPFLLADALADFSRADHDQALTHGARTCAAVTTTARALSDLGAHRAAA